MESVEMRYVFGMEHDRKEVNVIKNEDAGIQLGDLCEMFAEFLFSCGYSTENLAKYF